MTAPSRQKQSAEQWLAGLEKELAAARKVTAKRAAAVKRAENRLAAAQDEESDVQYLYDRALVDSWGDTPDWLTLLDGSDRNSVVMYDLARQGLKMLGLGTSMVNVQTGQRVVWLGFETDGEEELQHKLRGVQFILPFVKAGKNGLREISILHPQPDAFALSLAVDARTQSVSVVKEVWCREESRTAFPGLEAAMRFIQQAHSDTALAPAE